MLTPFAMHDSPRLRLAYPKGFSKFSHRPLPGSKQVPHGFYLGIGEFRGMVPFPMFRNSAHLGRHALALRLPPFGHFISGVGSVRAEKQMGRVATRGVVTRMAYKTARWYIPNGKRIGKPMSKNPTPLDAHPAVSTLEASRERPASIRPGAFINHAPKAGLYRLFLHPTRVVTAKKCHWHTLFAAPLGRGSCGHSGLSATSTMAISKRYVGSHVADDNTPAIWQGETTWRR